jgi:hypothetical protein
MAPVLRKLHTQGEHAVHAHSLLAGRGHVAFGVAGQSEGSPLPIAEEVAALPLRKRWQPVQCTHHRFHDCSSRGQAGDRSALSDEESTRGAAWTIVLQIGDKGFANNRSGNLDRLPPFTRIVIWPGAQSTSSSSKRTTSQVRSPSLVRHPRSFVRGRVLRDHPPVSGAGWACCRLYGHSL